jgi:hypothetical protein
MEEGKIFTQAMKVAWELVVLMWRHHPKIIIGSVLLTLLVIATITFAAVFAGWWAAVGVYAASIVLSQVYWTPRVQKMAVDAIRRMHEHHVV